ncbi:LytTR family transcriptional regulator DNA-binding domain-containing protein [Temperatibacter marinus]|uniref:LytTR family transcriptional regulator DNA-binding domain-containing protein n=1 Tax=Temperatibacter marinus TaxID=1456591 RepID=A0AA52EDU5_9PROT|nr:LytTR family transcriptional regulator DNA-binding domain-containing protein [Temperatibacter marinus]WND02956.1 LytTR family transcriptional regulator DNA-binding domain-containing protein [Temperatibacter marinus]
MIRFILYMAALLSSLGMICEGLLAQVEGQSYNDALYFIDYQDVTVCKGSGEAAQAVDFNSTTCRQVFGGEINPQNRRIWVQTTINIPREFLDRVEPIGLFFSGKASGRFYIEDQLVGQSGRPSSTPQGEVPGKIDAVFYLKNEWLKAGKNRLIMDLSAHATLLELKRPLQFIAIGSLRDPSDFLLRRHLAALLPLGVLLVGVLFFGLITATEKGVPKSIFIPLVALFALGHLVAEVSRGILNYDWIYHDLRLILVQLFGFAAAFSLISYVIKEYWPARIKLFSLVSFFILLVPIGFVPGFDNKSFMVFVTACGLGVLFCMPVVRQHASARIMAGGLCLFAVAVLGMPYKILDIYYFYLVSALILILFVLETKKIQRLKRQIQEDKQRAVDLQQALEEEREQQAPAHIQIPQEGKVVIIQVSHINHCKAASDYTEIYRSGAPTVLASKSISGLHEELGSLFIRVHRSWIVNRHAIDKLIRDPSGSGVLTLKDKTKVPVSRRIMPNVRKELIKD